MKCFRLILALALLSIRSACAETVVVPRPRGVTPSVTERSVRLGRNFRVETGEATDAWRDHLAVFGRHLQQLSHHDGFQLREAGGVVARRDPELAPEAYRVDLTPKGVSITASTLKGLSHATATLLQLAGEHGDKLPAQTIRDEPANAYRSFMIDLGRNPHSLGVLKETIDLCWFYKVDSLHLHLTDDQRWAFPSEAFPKLLSEHGKITWNEFAELTRYAHVRGVTLIPELEVPGHSALLCRAYPEVFGKNSTEVAQLDSSREAIKVLLDEMIELFPHSPYIHVGGDEAFVVPEDLQRDLINDLHAHLKAKGKKTIVWEGPALGRGDNKVNEEVIHINWRTINFPADQMLAAGYPVVNAAWDPLYVVDHYPRNNFTMASPQRVYERTELTRFAHFNPDIRTFAEPIVVEPNAKLIGFCMPWWEGRDENYLPLIVPRLIPMAAVAWQGEPATDYASFAERTAKNEATRAECFYPVTIKASPLALEDEGVFHGTTAVSLGSASEGVIRYSIDGSEPTVDSPRYTEPFDLEQTAIVRAALFADDEQALHGSRRKLTHVEPPEGNLALGKPVTASVPSGPLHTPARLTDGGKGNLDYFLGYPATPEPIATTIDLGEPIEFNQIVVHAYTSGRSYEAYEVQVSTHGMGYRTVAKRLDKPEQITPRAVHDFPPTTARYVRVLSHGNQGQVFDSFSRITEVEVFARP